MQRIADAPTGSVSVVLDSAGKPSFEIHAGSAWDRVQWTAELEARIPNVDAIYFGTLGQRSEMSRATIRQALSLAKGRRILRVLDVNLRKPFYNAELIRESVAWASVLKLSDDELPEVAAACGISTSQTAAETLQGLRERCGLDLVVITRGAEGALLVSTQGTIAQAGIPTTVVDTVGAGDSFTAAFVLGLLRGEPHRHILRQACETASAVCAHSGAVPTHFKPTTKLSISS
jgi:fructokinase